MAKAEKGILRRESAEVGFAIIVGRAVLSNTTSTTCGPPSPSQAREDASFQLLPWGLCAFFYGFIFGFLETMYAEYVNWCVLAGTVHCGDKRTRSSQGLTVAV